MKLDALRARLRVHRKTKKSAPKPRKRKRPDGKVTFCIPCGRKLSKLAAHDACDACAGFYLCDMCSACLDVEADDKVYSTQDVDDLEDKGEGHALCKGCFMAFKAAKA